MRDLSEGRERSQIFYFALPMLLGNLFQQFYSIVDSVIVGNLINKQALAAVGASFPVIFALISFVIGIGSGATIVISQYFGAKQYHNITRAVDTTYIFMFVISIFVTVGGLLIGESVFRFLALPDELLAPALEYYNIYILGAFAFFGFNTTSSILRGLGDSKTPVYFLIIATIVNIILDLVFIGYFHWGLAGAAWATVISQAGAFFTAVLYLRKNNEFMRFSLFKLVFDWRIFRQSLRIGLPTSFQQSFIAIGMMAVMGIVNQFGTNVIAAYSVAMRLNSLATLPAMTISSALSTFVGQNLGAGKIERVRKGFISTVYMSGAISVAVSLLVIVFGRSLMALFTNDEAVIQIGAEYLLIVGSFYLLFSTMFSITGVLRGAGATFITMISSIISLWLVRIPLAYIFSDTWGYVGIWWANPIGWGVGLIIVYVYYLSGRWKSKGIFNRS